MSRVAPRRPRVVEVHVSGTQLLATVAQFALDPHCPTCRGPAELRPSPDGAIDVHVEHLDGCAAL
ncbi:hypothetical protein N4G69_20205 [Streptomyces mirabilis]|uniref:hypothetical protein n=1 Tax=Streptomyces mirabilis TaxID=68239 RepID=UPI0021BF0FEE|nr:hypothetical protein [Streptomyces mirabilis]MCT9107929.1 hypothetical protein [Streptomyces mirabilis]